MFFDQLDERNAMVKSILAFKKVGLVSLADLGSQLSQDSSWLSIQKVIFFAQAPNKMIHVCSLALLMTET
jgi:hypothetical protein